MTTDSFAAWVEPLAGSYRENRAAVVHAVLSLTQQQLSLPTGDEGWSVREEVTHIAASDPDFVKTLGAILDGGAPDLSIFNDIDARNARNLEAWKSRSIEDIAGELETNGLALQRLLARLTEEDEARQSEGMPFPLGGLIKGYGGHGPYHLGQIRQAIAQSE